MQHKKVTFKYPDGITKMVYIESQLSPRRYPKPKIIEMPSDGRNAKYIYPKLRRVLTIRMTLFGKEGLMNDYYTSL